VPDMPASMPPQGGPAPAPGAQPPGQATGPSPASAPSPNRGIEAAALAKLAVHATAIQQLMMAFPIGSDISRDLREAVNKLAKHVPQGAVSPGMQMTEAQKMLMQQRQMAPQNAAAQASQMGGGVPAAPPPPPPPMAA